MHLDDGDDVLVSWIERFVAFSDVLSDHVCVRDEQSVFLPGCAS